MICKTITVDTTIATSTYRGYCIEETGSSTASAKFYAGTDATGQLLDSVKLTSGLIVEKTYPAAIDVPGGSLFVDLTGTVTAVIRYGS